MINKITATVIILLLIPALGAVSQPPEKKERLEEIVGRLFINYKSLNSVYRDLHAAALNNLNGSDQQLSYIQKTYVYEEVRQILKPLSNPPNLFNSKI